MNVGEKYWESELTLNGQPMDADRKRRATAAQASMDAWGEFHDLSEREQQNAEAVACEWIVLSVDDHGNIDEAESTGGYIPMSQCGEAIVNYS